MNIFSRITSFFTKSNPEWANLTVYSDMPQAIRMSNNFKTYVKEGYKNSDTLYKCVSYLIRNGAAIPPVLFTDITMKKRIEKHPLLDKINRPNPEQSGVAYRKEVLGYGYLAGNSFQYAIRGKNGPPDELWALRPDRMEILAQPKKGIVGYRHENIDGIIPPQNIAHLKYWNPDDDDQKGMGMSPVQAAALNIDMQIAGKKWNLGLMQNGARPPGIWKIPGLMGFNERKQLEQKLHDTYSGATRAGKSPLLDGGLDWKPTGMQPAQMEWLDSLKYNGGSIANILNMPPQLIGDTSSTTYDNMEQAKAASYTEEIFPTLDDFYALWNWWLIPMYPDLASSGACLYYDKETVEVVQKLIQAMKDAQAARAMEMWNDGLGTMNECRDFCGLPSLGPDGDVFKFGAILVQKSELGKYAEQSLAEPAAPPPALPEPLNVPGLPGQQPPQKPQGPNDNPSNNPDDNPPDNANKQPSKRIDWRKDTTDEEVHMIRHFNDHKRIPRYQKAGKKANYKIWKCAKDACTFCLENDGVKVAIVDTFPNGCDVPDDCHKFCKCEAHELHIPDDIDQSSLSKWSIATIVAKFAVALLASRHDKDVAAQRAKEEREDDSGDDEDKSNHISKYEYRKFMEEVLAR